MEPQLKTVTFIVNPRARGVSKGFEPEKAARYIEKQGVTCRLVIPDSADAVGRTARESAERGDDALLVIGGDGTQRDAAQGLGTSETALATLPGGTVNVWARELGIPLTVRAAIDAHLQGQRLRVDMGIENGKRFLLMASAGWDAAAANNVSQRLKRWSGGAAYVASFATLAPKLRMHNVTWSTPTATGEFRMAMIVISNTALYGGRVHFSPEASAVDGLLDIAAVCPSGLVASGKTAFNMATDRIAGDMSLKSFRTPEITIETPGIPLQVDGDYAGETPVTLSVEPRGLMVSVPAGPLPAILKSE